MPSKIHHATCADFLQLRGRGQEGQFKYSNIYFGALMLVSVSAVGAASAAMRRKAQRTNAHQGLAVPPLRASRPHRG
jgi:hypothetical protein